MYEEQLKELGLTENEVSVYLTLLKAGPLTSYSLSKKTSLSRGYLYELLEKLREKGIVSEITKDTKKHYQATPPKQLQALLQYRLENLSSVIPQLEKIEGIWKEETKVDVHKGKYAYKTLLNDVIGTVRKKEEVLVLGIDEELLMKLEPLYLKRYFAIAKRLHISERVIVKKGTKMLQEAETTQYRFLPEELIGKIVQFIYGNKVAILTLSEPLNLIIIEDKSIAATYRKQLDVLWGMATFPPNN